MPKLKIIFNFKGKLCWKRVSNTCTVLQMDITMLADHIMEVSTGRLKQEAMETETDSGKVGISSDVRLLSGYLGEVER